MKRILTVILGLLISITVAQSQRFQFKPDERPIEAPRLSDEEQIREMFSELIYGIRNNQIIRVARFFSENINLRARAQGKSNRLMPLLFQLDSLTIEVANDRAFVRCQLNDGWKLKETKELLTLKRSNGLWKIEESGLLTDLIADYFFVYEMSPNAPGITAGEQEQNVGGKSKAEGGLLTVQTLSPTLSVSAVASQTVSSFLMSNKAVIRRLVPYTDQWSITRSTTQSYIGESVFSSPIDGEVLRFSGTNDYMAFIIDRNWFRIIYGSLDGGWIKSYGDNAGDYNLAFPSAIDVDIFGNIYCINGLSRLVVKLKYNPSSETINYVSEIPIYGLINPVDVDIDNNGTPTNPNDDSFWVADKDANAILRVSPIGEIIDKATSAVDPYTSETIQFSGPTKVLKQGGSSGTLSIVDLGKRRVIIISSPSFQGTTISGHVRSAEFAPQTNVQFESLGRCYGSDALWAVDKNNGLLHTFDETGTTNYSVYLASVDLNQWNAPVAMASTVTSGSTSNSYDFLTLDTWNNSSGINAYLPGADFLNPFTEYTDWTSINPAWWGTTIRGTVPTSIKAKVDIYRSDGSFIKTLYGGPVTLYSGISGVIAWAGDVGNTIGKYRARFEVTPSANSSYGQYQQSPIVSDVWFSMPLKATMSGPTTVQHPEKPNVNQYTWTCNVTSGAPTFTYAWKKNGNNVGTNSPTYTEYYSYNGGGGGSYQFTLQVTVTDQSSPAQTKTISKTVTAYNSGGGGPIEQMAENENAEPIPDTYALSQNYPNPFNPETEIHFALPEPATVRLTVLDILGREVAVLHDGRLSAGYKSVHWNGRSEKGEAVSSGMYFYSLVAAGESGKEFIETKKMLMMK